MEASGSCSSSGICRPGPGGSTDLEGISQKVLTDSLRSLEEDGIVTRTVYPEVPPRVEYALSALGESMRPIIQAMETWGREYQEAVGRGE